MKPFIALAVLTVFLCGCEIGTQSGMEPDNFGVYNTHEPSVCDQFTTTKGTSPRPRFIILTRKMFSSELTAFAQEKSETFSVEVLIADDFVISDDQHAAQQIRERLADEYDSSRENYLLIVGAPNPQKRGMLSYALDQDWEIPIAYVPYLGEDNLPTADGKMIPTDQYYASLNQNWKDDNWNWMLRFDFKPQMMVGRVPVKTIDELRNWLTKTQNHKLSKNPKHSKFANDPCSQPGSKFASDFMDDFISQNANKISIHDCKNENGGEISVISNQDDADFVSIYSHGNSRAIVPGQVGYILEAEKYSFAKAPIIFAHACETAAPDRLKHSLALDLMQSPNGAVAYVGYTATNSSLIHPFWEGVYFFGYETLGKAVYQSKHRLFGHKLPTPTQINDRMALTLYGDPATKLTAPNKTLAVSSSVVYSYEPVKSCAIVSHEQEVELRQSVFSEPLVLDKTNSGSAVIELAAIDDPRQLPKINYLAVAGCDTEKETCTGDAVRLAGKLDFSCNQLVKKGENTFSFSARFNNSAVDVRFVLKTAKGTYYPNGCEASSCGWDYKVINEWEEQKVAADWMVVEFSTALEADPLPEFDPDAENPVYLSGSVLLETYNHYGVLIGSCYLNQADYAPAFN